MAKKHHAPYLQFCYRFPHERALAIEVTQEQVARVIGKVEPMPGHKEKRTSRHRTGEAVVALASKHGKKCKSCNRLVWYDAMYAMVSKIIIAEHLAREEGRATAQL